MADGIVVRLWFVRETPAARLYVTVPPERHPTDLDEVWVPKSVVEHTTKRGNAHEVTLPEWWAQKKGLL